ncbi:uncharacterized protein LOC124292202 [Haliotis rubra]|uniref:uncharacterized protein LOC124292202 n=1 Tax=Haliotis rubra TaxID=36100 RepID=UPI001EE5B8A2|nr:uncharacterized protein LOC124292202 [Haliotis rubra]
MSSKAGVYVLLSVLQFHSALCFTSPKRAWQLGDKAGAYEVESNADAVHPKLTDPIMVGSGHPSLTYKAFSFDGTDDYVKVLMNNADQFKKFSIFMLVYPTTTSGTLVHYRYTSGGTDGIDEIVISIDSGQVKFKTLYNSNDWTFTHPTSITLDAWHSVVYKRDMDSGTIHLDLDGSSSTHNAAPKDTVEYLGTPGELWLGKNIDSGNFFTGKITCVVFYDDLFPDTAKSEAYSKCNGLTSSSGKPQIL